MIIQIDKKTAENIKKLRIVEKETYDEIINRLMVCYKKYSKSKK